jgi:hypothetical protein
MSPRFLLDTNVLSELMREVPEPGVIDWFEQNRKAAMLTSAVSQAEILTGIALLPSGKRRTALGEAAQQMFGLDFAQRVCAFDAPAAGHYAQIVAARTRQGRPISTEDAQIAAIAIAGGLTLATRNTKDFQGITGLLLTDPWGKAPGRARGA